MSFKCFDTILSRVERRNYGNGKTTSFNSTYIRGQSIIIDINWLINEGKNSWRRQ